MYTSLKRIEAINCTKCHIYSILPALEDADRYLGYDPEKLLSFIDNDVHYTAVGQNRLRVIYTDLVKKLI